MLISVSRNWTKQRPGRASAQAMPSSSLPFNQITGALLGVNELQEGQCQ